MVLKFTQLFVCLCVCVGVCGCVGVCVCVCVCASDTFTHHILNILRDNQPAKDGSLAVYGAVHPYSPA